MTEDDPTIELDRSAELASSPVRDALGRLARLVLLCVALGIAAGFAWYRLAPTPAFVARGEELVFRKDLPGEYVAMDGWFAVIGAVAGVIVAVAVLRRGPLGPWRVVAVPLAGFLGSGVMWAVGHALGPDSPVLGAAVGPQAVLYGPLDVNAKGVPLVWPVVSLAVLTFALVWSSRDEQAADRSNALDGPPDGAS
jgi:hypothetical protein